MKTIHGSKQPFQGAQLVMFDSKDQKQVLKVEQQISDEIVIAHHRNQNSNDSS
jgi:hypothetical protein